LVITDTPVDLGRNGICRGFGSEHEEDLPDNATESIAARGPCHLEKPQQKSEELSGVAAPNRGISQKSLFLKILLILC
jgi:hypothetical protein